MYIEIVPATIEQGNAIRQQIVDDMASALCKNPETLTNSAACDLALARAHFSSGVIAAFKHRAMDAAASRIPARPTHAPEKIEMLQNAHRDRTDANVDRFSRALGKLATVMAQVGPGSDFLLVSCSQPFRARDAS